ncbi:MAG: hypothetical protein ACETVN_02795 [Asgard group archaeon]
MKKKSQELITLVETSDTVECQSCLIYPLGLDEITSPNTSPKKERVVYIDVSEFHELKMIAEIFKKSIFYDVYYYYVILDNAIHYRTKRYDKIYRKYGDFLFL